MRIAGNPPRYGPQQPALYFRLTRLPDENRIYALLGVLGIKALAAAPQIRGLIQPAIDVRMLVEVAYATLVLGLCGSGYPAWRANRFRPADALRHE